MKFILVFFGFFFLLLHADVKNETLSSTQLLKELFYPKVFCILPSHGRALKMQIPHIFFQICPALHQYQETSIKFALQGRFLLISMKFNCKIDNLFLKNAILKLFPTFQGEKNYLHKKQKLLNLVDVRTHVENQLNNFNLKNSGKVARILVNGLISDYSHATLKVVDCHELNSKLKKTIENEIIIDLDNFNCSFTPELKEALKFVFPRITDQNAFKYLFYRAELLNKCKKCLKTIQDRLQQYQKNLKTNIMITSNENDWKYSFFSSNVKNENCFFRSFQTCSQRDPEMSNIIGWKCDDCVHRYTLRDIDRLSKNFRKTGRNLDHNFQLLFNRSKRFRDEFIFNLAGNQFPQVIYKLLENGKEIDGKNIKFWRLTLEIEPPFKFEHFFLNTSTTWDEKKCTKIFVVDYKLSQIISRRFLCIQFLRSFVHESQFPILLDGNASLTSENCYFGFESRIRVVKLQKQYLTNALNFIFPHVSKSIILQRILSQQLEYMFPNQELNIKNCNGDIRDYDVIQNCNFDVNAGFS